jgi:hypothetical protein
MPDSSQSSIDVSVPLRDSKATTQDPVPLPPLLSLLQKKPIGEMTQEELLDHVKELQRMRQPQTLAAAMRPAKESKPSKPKLTADDVLASLNLT